MRDVDAPSAAEAAIAYALSSAGTLLWVGCVLPAGTLVDAGLLEELRTPMHRSAVLLVPALLLMVLGPVAVTIARGTGPLRGALAAVDTFVCLYAAAALDICLPCEGSTFWILTGLLALLGVLSAVETLRYLQAGIRGRPPPRIAGLRLALALLVLLMPSWFLVQSGTELASLLAPFGFVALSTGGSRAIRTGRGLRRLAAVLFTALAAHLFVALRYTIFDGEPRLDPISPAGWGVTVGAAMLLLLALVGVGVAVRSPGGRAAAGAPEPLAP